jgi:uncharacterized protein (TIGR03437 family)
MLRNLRLLLLAALWPLSAQNLPSFPTKPVAGQNSLIYAMTFGNAALTSHPILFPNNNYSEVTSVAAGPNGSIYLFGITFSDLFPAAGPLTGLPRFFLARYSKETSTFIFATTFTPFDLFQYGLARNLMALDSTGNAYIAGPANLFKADDSSDCRVLKFDPFGRQIGTILLTHAGCSSLAVDAFDNAYISGTTTTGFQGTSGALQIPNAHLLLLKLNQAGTAIVYSAVFGSNVNPALAEATSALTVDSAGQAYVAGQTTSPDFPTTAGVFQPHHSVTPNPPTLADGADGFVAKFSADGSKLLYSTFLGGSASEAISSIAVNGVGEIFVAGATGSVDFPVTQGAYQTSGGEGSPFTVAFVSKINSTGTALVYSTVFNYARSASSLAIDAAGDAYFASNYLFPIPTTRAVQPDFPSALCPLYQEEAKGQYVIEYYTPCGAAIVVGFNPTGTSLVLSTYLSGSGGPGSDASAVAFDPDGNLIVGGVGQLRLAKLNPDWNQGFAFVVVLDPRASPPVFTAKSIVNTASMAAGGVREGGLLSIFCIGITGIHGVVTGPNDPVPQSMAGVTVLINGTPAPILAVADLGSYQQINIQVPALPPETPSYEYEDDIYVMQNGQLAMVPNLNFFLAAPGIFTTDGVRAVAVHSADFKLIDSSRPAKPGEIVTFYATGLGRLDPPILVGWPAPYSPISAAYPVTVTVQGKPARVLFAGAAPGFVGVNQVNIQLPDQLTPGDADLVVSLSQYIGMPQVPFGQAGYPTNITPASTPAKLPIQN